MPEPLRIASLAYLTDDLRSQIHAVDDRIVLQVIDQETGAWLYTQRGGAQQKKDHSEKVRAITQDAEIWFCNMIPNLPFATANSLRWIQLLSAGVDRILEQPVPENVTMTNVSGLHATPIGEWVITFMLMHVKNIAKTIENQKRKRWERSVHPENLHGSTIGIIGMGAIGQEVARLSKAFGAQVIATRRSAFVGEKIPNCDLVYPLEDLHILLDVADYVILSLPLTKETRGMIGKTEFSAMGPSTTLINIARGDLVDWEAMLNALRKKQIQSVNPVKEAPKYL